VSSLPPLAPMATDNPPGSGRQGVRTPKTAELVARTLRQMIVDGKLKDGDFLPNEPELMNHFRVSRPTLREAVRVLESERLVEVRRGSRTGAQVRVPGPEIVARPAGLLLELSGATIADVLVARSAIEPVAARLLALNGKVKAFDELEQILTEDIPASLEAARFAAATAHFHRRLVELSGNATLSMIAGMLHEITERHTAVAVTRKRSVPKPDYDKLVRSYRHLIKLLHARDGDEAEAHWRRHMDNSRKIVLRGLENIKVRDVMD
jgi:GntR family transcriptional repressor for pyruvate dehydrogenase complex